MTMRKAVVGIAFALAQVAVGADGFLTYEEFGAVGDGRTDDLKAIVATHEAANARELPVRATDGKTYYLSGAALTASVRTDVDFGRAKFIIDDVRLENVKAPVFRVESASAPLEVRGVSSLKRGQKSLDVRLPGRCLVEVVNAKVRKYIRRGRNQNSGESQQEVLVVGADGTIDASTPVLWDYEVVTGIRAFPIDEKTLTVRGGEFTTVANQAESKYNYYGRGIAVSRSNVRFEGLTHLITGEGDHGAPYGGFISISRAADVELSDCVFTAHRTYSTIGSAKKPVQMGSYDLQANRSAHILVRNCRQTTDICDRRYWGLFASNYCKDIEFDGCSFSRFDAHMGVANATIRNCTLGYMGVNAIGFGTFLVENTTVRGGSFFNLRPDYGSTWDGEFIVRKSRLVPEHSSALTLVTGRNDGTHDFGYPCRMPRRIVFEDFVIEDAELAAPYAGPCLFADFIGGGDYRLVEEVVLDRVVTTSGKPLRTSPNPALFAAVKGVPSIKEAPSSKGVSSNVVAQVKFGRGALCMSFDDRNFSGWDKAMPVFEKHGAHATFCIMGPIDAVALEHVRRYHAAGHSIALHGLNHKPLERKNTEESVVRWYEEELTPQADALAAAGIAVTAVAYPNNRRDEVADRVLGRYFRHVRAGAYPRPDKSLAESDWMFKSVDEVSRSVLMSGTGIGTRESYTSDFSQFADALKRCAERNEIFCTYSHNIQPNAKSMNCPTELLEQILAEAQRLGVAVIGYDELP